MTAGAIPESSSVTSSRVLVKVCGLSDVDQALACASAGADWLGLNFHPPSPRCIGLDRAAEIAAALPSTTRAIGVFVDEPIDRIRAAAERVGLWAVQLHGDETPADVARLGDSRVIKAFRLRSAADWPRVLAFVREVANLGGALEGILVDAYVPGQAGGTGQTIAEELLDLMAGTPRLILAGGLNRGNVARLVARVRPFMVDVASGVESAPGRKDPAEVAAFVRAVRVGEQVMLDPSPSLKSH